MELAVAVELNDGADVAFVEVVVTAAATDAHADGDVVAHVRSIVVSTGKIRLPQIRRERVQLQSW